ncbi:hypothetical protein DFJ73DRAFT_306746 [Zopfochytrium polystomum]|nr:hypothetical protein DFJ73DRAFT_306746 [Zopfochytrium polystomum]
MNSHTLAPHAGAAANNSTAAGPPSTTGTVPGRRAVHALTADIIYLIAQFVFDAVAPRFLNACAPATARAYHYLHTEPARTCRAWRDAILGTPLTLVATLLVDLEISSPDPARPWHTPADFSLSRLPVAVGIRLTDDPATTAAAAVQWAPSSLDGAPWRPRARCLWELHAVELRGDQYRLDSLHPAIVAAALDALVDVAPPAESSVDDVDAAAAIAPPTARLILPTSNTDTDAAAAAASRPARRFALDAQFCRPDFPEAIDHPRAALLTHLTLRNAHLPRTPAFPWPPLTASRFPRLRSLDVFFNTPPPPPDLVAALPTLPALEHLRIVPPARQALRAFCDAVKACPRLKRLEFAGALTGKGDRAALVEATERLEGLWGVGDVVDGKALPVVRVVKWTSLMVHVVAPAALLALAPFLPHLQHLTIKNTFLAPTAGHGSSPAAAESAAVELLAAVEKLPRLHTLSLFGLFYFVEYTNESEYRDDDFGGGEEGEQKEEKEGERDQWAMRRREVAAWRRRWKELLEGFNERRRRRGMPRVRFVVDNGCALFV